MPHGKSIPLRVKTSDAIKNIKEKIQQEEGIALNYQCVLLNGKHLKDGCTLNDCNVIQEDLTLHLKLSEYILSCHIQ